MVRRRGGEKCLDAFARLLPGADLFTLVHDPEACPAPPGIGRIVTSPLQRRPGAKRWFRAWLPRFPQHYRALDLSGYGLVLTSDASVAKTVRVPEGVPHICYCYSPVRYAFDLRDVYLRESVPGPLRPLARQVLNRLAAADREAAQKVTAFIAISEHVADRIRRCYGRESQVIYPPVDVEFFHPADAASSSTSASPSATAPYLLLGEAVAYKRFDLAVRACRDLDRELIVAGGGPHFERLRRIAGPRTRFISKPDDLQVRELYRGCRALLFPGEEDFGLVPVEAMACGRPVIAYGVGGAAETVVHEKTGIVYHGDGVLDLTQAIETFEAWEHKFERSNAVSRAGMFSQGAHERAMRRVLATFTMSEPTHDADAFQTD